MMRTFRFAAALAVLVALACGVSWTVFPSTSRAAFNATTWHYSNAWAVPNTTLPNTPVTLFTVPPGQDLTITDITYSFKYLGGGLITLPGGSHLDSGQVTVYDGGPNPNPTNFGPASVLDTCVLNVFSFSVGGDAVDMANMDVNINTEAHHFQTGLVIPGGNDLKMSHHGFFSNTDTVLVTISASGILQ
jgi:hypothetical protein